MNLIFDYTSYDLNVYLGTRYEYKMNIRYECNEYIKLISGL